MKLQSLSLLITCLIILNSQYQLQAKSKREIVVFYPSPYGEYEDLRTKFLAVGPTLMDASLYPPTNDGSIYVETKIDLGDPTPGSDTYGRIEYDKLNKELVVRAAYTGTYMKIGHDKISFYVYDALELGGDKTKILTGEIFMDPSRNIEMYGNEIKLDPRQEVKIWGRNVTISPGKTIGGQLTHGYAKIIGNPVSLESDGDIIATSSTITINTSTISAPTADVTFKTVYAPGSDYAEYFKKDSSQKLNPGDVVQINPDTGLVELYDGTGIYLGIVSSDPVVVGNYQEGREKSPEFVLVSLVGQVKFNRSQVLIDHRIVYTKDKKYRIGILLANGKVLLR